MTKAAAMRALVAESPLSSDEILAKVGGPRKSGQHYLCKMVYMGLLVRLPDGRVGPGRPTLKDWSVTPEEKAIRLKARNAKHNALKRARRLAAGLKPRPTPQTPEERRAKAAAHQRAKRAAKRALSPPKPPKAPRVRAKSKPAPKRVQALRKPKPPGMVDCAKSKPAPQPVRAMTTAEFIAQGGRIERIPTPEPVGYGACPVRQRQVGVRAI